MLALIIQITDLLWSRLYGVTPSPKKCRICQLGRKR